MLYSDIWNRILFIEISGVGDKMKIVVAMDSYKGCCSAAVAGAAVCRGILRADPTIEAINLPVSDGGDGMEYSRFLPFAAARSAALTRTFLTLI